MRVVIFVNGQLSEPQSVTEWLHPDDYIIAVNGGTHHALSVGVMPHVIIGDLDSLLPDERAQVEAAGVKIARFSPCKDETDLELAIRYALEQHATEIVMFAALGGRLDHALANIFLLTLPELQGLKVSICEDYQTAFLIRDKACIKGKPGDTVSILPIGGDAVGVSNDGFEWPLHEATLPLGTTRGISNVLRTENASISVKQGLLFCVVSQKLPDLER
jgi:thiamine pyrophosphokinase